MLCKHLELKKKTISNKSYTCLNIKCLHYRNSSI